MPKNQTSSLDSAAALKLISAVEKLAATASDDAKKILLAAGCQIADLVIEQTSSAQRAA